MLKEREFAAITGENGNEFLSFGFEPFASGDHSWDILDGLDEVPEAFDDVHITTLFHYIDGGHDGVNIGLRE